MEIASCSESEAEESDLLQPVNGVKSGPGNVSILPRSNLRVNTKNNNDAQIEMSEYNWKKTDASPSGSFRKKFVFTIPGVMKQQQPREYKLKAFVVFLFFLIVIYISLTYVFHKQQELYILHTEIAHGIHFHEKTRMLRILNTNKYNVLRGELGINLGDDLMPYECYLPAGKRGRCFRWKNGARLLLTHQRASKYNQTSTTRCYTVEWEAITSQIQDCFDTSGAIWFGVGETKRSEWPLNIDHKSINIPFVTGDETYKYGGILERYWLSSKGVSLSVDKNVPLFVSTDDHEICLRAKWDFPYHQTTNKTKLGLKYTVCAGNDLKSVHRHVSTHLRDKTDKPNQMINYTMERVIWLNKNASVDRTALIEFADSILGFIDLQVHSSTIVIGEGWQKDDGDLIFDGDKFSNPEEVVSSLHNKGFQLALVVHPYISTSSINYLKQIDNDFWLSNIDQTAPALTRWHDIRSAAILDITNQNAVTWFLAKLKNLNVDGFIFEGGESSYLPRDYVVKNPITNPDSLSAFYVTLAFRSGQCVSISSSPGVQSENGFVLLAPRIANWGRDHGLQSLIPLVLSVGLAGFPFINPGSVGGDETQRYEGELFIRWMQVATFLPVVQFSTLPQDYGEEVSDAAKNLLKLRLEVVLPVLRPLVPDALRSGIPLIRPLWWADPNDTVTLNIDSQFLVGDDMLVAPVLEAGGRHKDVYFPSGLWNDTFQNRVISGPKWMFRLPVPLNQVLFFTRVKV